LKKPRKSKVLSFGEDLGEVIVPKPQSVPPQNINPMKNNNYRGDTQPMGVKRIADIAMKQINDGMA